MRVLAEPPHWSAEELDEWRTAALADFVAQRGREGTAAYAAAFDQLRPRVEEVFRATDDLTTWRVGLLIDNPELVSPMRYLIAPLISADDLDAMVGGRTRNRRIDPELAGRVVTLVEAGLDPIRYPWLRAGRAAAGAERRSAIAWTAGVWASEYVRTARKTKLNDLLAAQESHRIALFWETDLSPLRDFLERSRSSSSD